MVRPRIKVIYKFSFLKARWREVLSAIFGTPNERDQVFEERLTKLIQLRSDLADFEDAGID